MDERKKNRATVTVRKVISIQVGDWLCRRANFAPANFCGQRLGSLSKTDALGILWTDPNAKPKKRLFGRAIPPRRWWIGTIFFDDATRGADEDTCWVLEAYGQSHFDLVKDLAYDMATKFNVEISIELVRERVRMESRFTPI